VQHRRLIKNPIGKNRASLRAFSYIVVSCGQVWMSDISRYGFVVCYRTPLFRIAGGSRDDRAVWSHPGQQVGFLCKKYFRIHGISYKIRQRDLAAREGRTTASKISIRGCVIWKFRKEITQSSSRCMRAFWLLFEISSGRILTRSLGKTPRFCFVVHILTSILSAHWST